MSDTEKNLQQQVLSAVETRTPLRIVGGDSKHFYGNAVSGEVLSTASHSGILSYEPTELVITARAGTPLQEVQNALDEKHQMLGFEPPSYDDSATLGGTVACNLSGPRRAYAGAARDFVLGTRIINGKGEAISFGGEVMKNVAGYDVSRLMCGALGTLGVMLEVSLKVLPRPEYEQTMVLECTPEEALKNLHAWGQFPLPVSATCFADSQLVVRFSGSEKAVKTSAAQVGGIELPDAREFWRILREQKLSFFNAEKPLWRLSLASDAPQLGLSGETLWEWGGALRWLSSDEDVTTIQAAAAQYGGHATLFRSAGSSAAVFHPLDDGMLHLHRQLKKAFDPHNILNPGKMYPEV